MNIIDLLAVDGQNGIHLLVVRASVADTHMVRRYGPAVHFETPWRGIAILNVIRCAVHQVHLNIAAAIGIVHVLFQLLVTHEYDDGRIARSHHFARENMR